MSGEPEPRPNDAPEPAPAAESIRREMWALLVLYAALAIVPLLLGFVVV